MKILVTGGAGFIGSNLIRLWLAADPKVRIVNLDKLTYCGDLARLKAVQKNSRYQFIKADVCDRKAVSRAMEGCDGVVHAAAETHVDRSLLEAKDFFDSNLYGTYVLLEQAKKQGLKRFLYVSTDEVYGSCAKGHFKETDALNPTSPYSISKTAADFLVRAYAESHGVDAVVTRGSNTFGPYQFPEKVLPLFIANALAGKSLPLYGDGRQVRNWMHVDDHARGIITVFKKGKRGEAYNLATPHYLENIVLTKTLLTILGKPHSLIQKVQDRVGHDRRYAISPAKALALGWKPSQNFKNDLEQTVRWYVDNRSWLESITQKGQAFKAYYQKAYKARQ